MYSCIICCENVSHTYSICSCSHRFCQNCCISHISAKLNNFNKITCLQDKCKNNFDQNSQISNKLSVQQKAKLNKYKLFKKISGNPHLRQCRKQDCQGIMDVSKKQKICFLCKSLHCFKCFQLDHKGQCKRQDDSMMIVLNYRRCPKCQVWVQKIGGCQYLYCKCGVMFCFQCGVQFQYDPCRKSMYLQKQRQIRIILHYIKIMIPETIIAKILFIPFLLLKLLILIILTITGSVLFLSIIIIALPIVSIISPIVLFFVVLNNVKKHGQSRCNYKCILIFLMTIILYPLITGFSIIILIGIIVSYPICRNIYPTRLYDLFDQFNTTLTLIYIQIIEKLLSCNV